MEKRTENLIQETKRPSEHKEQTEGVEVISSSGSKKILEKLSTLDKTINHDEAIYLKDIDDIENALQSKDVRVVIGDLELSVIDLERLGEENPEFLEGVRQNKVKSEGKLSFMTPEIAKYLSKNGKHLSFNNLKELPEDIAEILSENKDPDSYMFFKNISVISDKTAECLRRYKGIYLSLDGLKSLSESAAESLSKRPGYSLGLNGLRKISDEAAESLSKCKIKSLSLNGLIELSDKAAEYIGNYEGTHLELNGLTDLSDSVAEDLSKSKAYLDLRGIKTISDSVAAHFANFRGEQLGFHNLTTLSDKAAEYLSKYEGYLHLDKVVGISERVAEHLSQHKGGIDFQYAKQTEEQVAKYKQ